MVYNEKAWKIVKNYLPTHYIGVAGPCCDRCSMMLRAVVEAQKVAEADNRTSCAVSYKLGYDGGKRDAHVDDPDMDGTDFAHPAWWRGHKYSFAMTCREVNDILDGKKANVGTATQPWQALRQRLYDIRTLLGLAERVISGTVARPLSPFYMTIIQWYKVRQDYAKRVAQIQKENTK
jgi:hypothetical protein